MRLQLLDPKTDLELYRLSYSWRQPKKHIQPDRMPFEVFAEDSPLHITFGLFDDELLAVYFLHEVDFGVFEAHFTSRRNVSRIPLLKAAQEIIRMMLENGARQINAWILERNVALCRFVEDLGMVYQESQIYPCASESNCPKIPDGHPAPRVFLKYVIEGGEPSV